MPILKYGNAKLTKVNNKFCLFPFASSLETILILILEIEAESSCTYVCIINKYYLPDKGISSWMLIFLECQQNLLKEAHLK